MKTTDITGCIIRFRILFNIAFKPSLLQILFFFFVFCFTNKAERNSFEDFYHQITKLVNWFLYAYSITLLLYIGGLCEYREYT